MAVTSPKDELLREAHRNGSKDSIILSAACGKFSYNRRDYGEIEGIPHFMDFGHCNNVYSIIQIAGALAKELDLDLNDLPVSIVLSRMEQKAIGILYTILYLGIKGIHIEPKASESIAIDEESPLFD